MPEDDGEDPERQAARWLLSAPFGDLPKPPILTRTQVLPIGELSPENVERLFLRVLLAIEDIEHAALFGTPGQAQDGIDVYGRRRLELGAQTSARDYVTLQSKRITRLTPSQIRVAVSAFMKGKWAKRSAKFYFATSHSLRPTALANEIVTQTDRLAKVGVELITIGAEELSLHLKALPEVVDDFFGREWVSAHCGTHAANSIKSRLDRAQYDAFRSQLRSFYINEFRLHSPVTALGTFEVLDVTPLARQVSDSGDQKITRPTATELNTGDARNDPRFIAARRSVAHRSRILRDFSESDGRDVRLPLLAWIGDHRRTLLVGAPGAGKSTFLRFLAADLLADEPRSSDLILRAGEQLPLWIPFAYLCRHLAENTSHSILSAARAWLESRGLHELASLVTIALRDKRMFVIVDGIDEWTTADEARTALELFESFLNSTGARALLSTRPYAIGEVPRRLDWSEGRLAPLNRDQITRIVKQLAPASDASNMIIELEASHESASLARVPLFLTMLIDVYQAGRFRASKLELIDEFVQRFLAEMPRLRPRQSETPIGDDETRAVLAELAWRLRSESVAGIAPATKIRSHLVDILATQVGVERRTAIEWTKALFEAAEQRFAVLVSQGGGAMGFVHRLILEHLAGGHLANQPVDVQQAEFELLLDDPSWRDALIATFAQSGHQGVLEEVLAGSLRTGTQSPERWEFAADLFAAGVAISPAASSQLSRSIADRIEGHPWRAHRARLARSVGEAAGNGSVDPVMIERMRRWVRGVISDPRRGIWAARKVAVGREDQVCKLFYWGLQLPQWETKLKSADAFAARYSVAPFDETIPDRIRNEQDTETQAGLLLAAGWAWQDDRLEELLEWAGKQPSYSLTSVAANLRHKWGRIATTDDLTPEESNLIRNRLDRDGYSEPWLGLTNPLVDLAFETDNTAARDRAFEVLSDNQGGGNAARHVAFTLACGAFADDPRFRQWVITKLLGEHPLLGYDARMLPESWASHADYVAASLDAITRDAGGFGGGGVEGIRGLPKTPAYRDALLAGLDNPRPTSLALAVWGQFSDDAVAQQALRSRLGASPVKAAEYAYLATRVLGLREGFARLIELATAGVSAAGPESFDVARNALALTWSEMKTIESNQPAEVDMAEAASIVDATDEDEIASLCFGPKPTHIDWGIDEYFLAFRDTAIARQRAGDWLANPFETVAQVPEVLPGALLSGFADMPDQESVDIVDGTLHLMAYLPPDIREVLIQGLGRSSMSLEALVSIAGDWQHDSDDECLRAWAVVFGSRLRTDRDAPGAEKVRVSIHELLVMRGMRHDESRQSAWVAALLAEDLDLLDAGESDIVPAITLRRKFSSFEEPLIARVAALWDLLREKYGADLEKMVDARGFSSDKPDPIPMWAALAGAPEKSEGLKEDLRRAVRALPGLRTHPRVVQWVAGGEYDKGHLSVLLKHLPESRTEQLSDETAFLLRQRSSWQVTDDEMSEALLANERGRSGGSARLKVSNSYSDMLTNLGRAVHVEALPDHPVSKALVGELAQWFETHDRNNRAWDWTGVAGVGVGGVEAPLLPDLLLRIHSRLATADSERDFDLIVDAARRRLARDPLAVRQITSAIESKTPPRPADPFFGSHPARSLDERERLTLAFLLAAAGRLQPDVLEHLETKIAASGRPMINPLTGVESSIRVQLLELRDLVRPLR